MLTLQMLKDMPPDTIFATGTANDDPSGLFMANTNRQLRWVAVRGGIHDWTIYCHFAECHFAEHSAEWIKAYGDKVAMERHIRRLVPCDDESFAMYRY